VLYNFPIIYVQENFVTFLERKLILRLIAQTKKHKEHGIWEFTQHFTAKKEMTLFQFFFFLEVKYYVSKEKERVQLQLFFLAICVTKTGIKTYFNLNEIVK